LPGGHSLTFEKEPDLPIWMNRVHTYMSRTRQYYVLVWYAAWDKY
jgi:hypothetical protein